MLPGLFLKILANLFCFKNDTLNLLPDLGVMVTYLNNLLMILESSVV